MNNATPHTAIVRHIRLEAIRNVILSYQLNHEAAKSSQHRDTSYKNVRESHAKKRCANAGNAPWEDVTEVHEQRGVHRSV